MRSAIAILTYRRLHALKTELEGVRQHCAQYPLAVFEDCGNADATSVYLSQGSHALDPELMADRYEHPDGFEAFVGRINLGVAGNSNRAIRWMERNGYDHLLLCNDDLHVLGDFVQFYAKAHKDLGVGMFCFNDFWESPTHRWTLVRSRGYRIRLFQRITGIMVSITRDVVNKIGYFNTRYPKFGEEHCDFTYRARFAGFVQLDGQDQPCLDIEPTLPDGRPGNPVLKHQEVETSVKGLERQVADKEASQVMQQIAAKYPYESYYQPFRLTYPPFAGNYNRHQGVPFEFLQNYALHSACS